MTPFLVILAAVVPRHGAVRIEAGGSWAGLVPTPRAGHGPLFPWSTPTATPSA